MSESKLPRTNRALINNYIQIYSLPFPVTKEIKLSIFQYKIIHNFFTPITVCT